MIFATVGSQMPFDRLILALSDWAEEQSNSVEIFSQVGNTDIKPALMKAVSSLSPSAFRNAVQDAEIVVAHAGMGAVLTAMEFGKRLVVLPRLGALQETRNDHQVATADWLSHKPGIYVAMCESELGRAIDRARSEPLGTKEISPFATPELIAALKTYILS